MDDDFKHWLDTTKTKGASTLDAVRYLHFLFDRFGSITDAPYFDDTYALMCAGIVKRGEEAQFIRLLIQQPTLLFSVLSFAGQDTNEGRIATCLWREPFDAQFAEAVCRTVCNHSGEELFYNPGFLNNPLFATQLKYNPVLLRKLAQTDADLDAVGPLKDCGALTDDGVHGFALGLLNEQAFLKKQKLLKLVGAHFPHLYPKNTLKLISNLQHHTLIDLAVNTLGVDHNDELECLLRVVSVPFGAAMCACVGPILGAVNWNENTVAQLVASAHDPGQVLYKFVQHTPEHLHHLAAGYILDGGLFTQEYMEEVVQKLRLQRETTGSYKSVARKKI